MSLYAYYMKTKTEPDYDQVEQRYKLYYLYKYAAKEGFNFDVEKYNEKQRQLRSINKQLQSRVDILQ